MLLLLRYLLLLVSPLLFDHLISFVVSLVVLIDVRTHELFRIYLALSIIILVHFHKSNNANLPKIQIFLEITQYLAQHIQIYLSVFQCLFFDEMHSNFYLLVPILSCFLTSFLSIVSIRIIPTVRWFIDNLLIHIIFI